MNVLLRRKHESVSRYQVAGHDRGRSLGRLLRIATVLVLLFALVTAIGARTGEPQPHFTFRLVTGAENRSLVPLIEQFADSERVRVEISHQGSVDTMLELQEGATAYDAVWPASSIWLSLGDTRGVVSQTKNIMATPVVFGVKYPVAERLGWVGREVGVAEILAAAESGQFRFMTTSATQSNSGAMAYLGFLYAFAGQPEVLTAEMLRDPNVIERTKRMLRLVDRTAGASGFLRDLFLQQYDAFDGMVNNESAIITANQQLTSEGRAPLYVIYPFDGLAVADWPLGYVDHGIPEKASFFLRLQEHLLSDTVQAELLAQGRRVGIGLRPQDADLSVFNPAWGIDLDRVITPITLPSPDVIHEALSLYQTALRKPSFTVFCLDFSGSMDGEGARDLKSAMRVLLNPEEAKRYMLQPSAEDVTVVIPFNDAVIDEWRVEGNNPEHLGRLLAQVTAQDTGGGTNMYDCIQRGLEASAGINTEIYAPAITLMTDGRSNQGSFDDVSARLQIDSAGPIPIYAILFGDASESQLRQVTEATSGRIFDGQGDLVGAMREAKGYN